MSLLVGRSGAKLAPELYGVTKIAQLCLVMAVVAEEASDEAEAEAFIVKSMKFFRN